MRIDRSSPDIAEAKAEKTHILWASNMDDAGYADILFLVGDEPPYGVGINVGGNVIVKPLRDWHAAGCASLQGVGPGDGCTSRPALMQRLESAHKD